MATADNRTDEERRNLIELASQQYLGRTFGEEGWQAFKARPDMTVEQRIGEMMTSPEAQAYAQRKIAESTTAPITGAEQGQYLAEAQRTLAPLQAAFASTIEQQKKSAQQEYADTETRLREAAAAEKQGVGVELSNRGFLRSGEQIGRFEQIGKNLISDISKADINRALQEANLVLQQVQFESEIGQKAATAAQTRAEQEYSTRSRTAELNRLRYEQQDALASGNIDRYLQLEETARQREAQLQEQEYNRQMQELQMQQVQAEMQQKNTDIITADGRLKLIDTQTGEEIRDLGSAPKTGSSGGSTQTERLRSELGNLFSETQNLLNEHTGSDGFVDTGIYRDQLNKVIKNYPDQIDTFLQYFPPDKILNVSNDTGAAAIARQYGTGDAALAQAQAIINNPNASQEEITRAMQMLGM